MGAIPLRIWFEKIDRFIKIYDEIRYLVLFPSKRYNAIYNRIKYLITEKSRITDSVNHNFARIRIDPYNSLPTEKILTFHNVIILIKSVVNITTATITTTPCVLSISFLSVLHVRFVKIHVTANSSIESISQTYFCVNFYHFFIGFLIFSFKFIKIIGQKEK